MAACDTAAIIHVIDICIVSDRSVRGPGVLNIPPTSYLARNCLHSSTSLDHRTRNGSHHQS